MTTKIIGGLTAVAAAVGILLTGAAGTASANTLYFTEADCEADAAKIRSGDVGATCTYDLFRNMYELHVWG
ncbi:hypothetical protein [Allokutzneria multivorans]